MKFVGHTPQRTGKHTRGQRRHKSDTADEMNQCWLLPHREVCWILRVILFVPLYHARIPIDYWNPN